MRTSRSPTSKAPAPRRRSRGRSSACSRFSSSPRCAPLSTDLPNFCLIYLLSDLSDKVEKVARLSATETARNFSAILNRVAAGEEIEITRNGTTIAVIGPPRTRLLSPERLRELLVSAPPVDDEFATDIHEIR